MRSNYALRYISNNLTLTPDMIASMTITCTGTDDPMPDCTPAAATKTVKGWIGAAVST